jgi:Zn-dependent oligopeptidase
MTEAHATNAPHQELRDYSGITAHSVRADLDDGLADADRRLEALVAEPPDDAFAVVAALDDIQADVFALAGRTAFLDLVHTDEHVRAEASTARARIATWDSALLMRSDIASLVAGLPSPGRSPDPEEREASRLLAHWQRDLRRTGHGLPSDVRGVVRTLRARLAEIESAYETNITADDTGIDVTPSDLDGLPDDWGDRLGPARTPGAEAGTVHVSLAYPEQGPFLAQARRRDLRQQLLTRSLSRAAAANRPLLEEGLAVRRRLAELLGYPSWADYATEVRMAGSAGRADTFLDDLERLGTAEWTRELAELRVLAEELSATGQSTGMAADDVVFRDGTALQQWDVAYLLRARRERRIGIDPSEFAGYFSADRVVPAMLDMMGSLFDLDFSRIPDASVWHPDVMVYAVADRTGGELLGYVYLDLFARDGKYSHGQASRLTRPRDLPTGRQVAVSALVTNFNGPHDARPALLRHDQLVVLFHEFGHIVHHVVTHTRFFRFSGTNVEKDFVEAPSRLMERWAWDPEVLQLFAHHRETGAPPPAGVLERLVTTRFDDEVFIWMWSLWISRVDLDMHAATGAPDLDRLQRERSAVMGLPYIDDTFELAGIGHMFDGYDAGFYSYQWAEVIGDTMVARLEHDGLLDPQAVTAFRTAVLEPGGSCDADELVERFLGGPADLDGFLALRGWTG